MYARLWWKEMRTFWPIWPALGVVAAGVQWFLLWSQVAEARRGLLIVLGLGWSLLYAFAVGAGGFAAEREANTQAFLDTLPVGRRMLWTSKISFALATTLGLALVLAALGALGTAERDPGEYPLDTFVLGHGVLLFEAVAWSLLWSVILGSAIQAAVLGIVTVSLLSVQHLQHLDQWKALVPLVPESSLGPRLALAGAALGVSWFLFTRGPRRARVIRVREKKAWPGSRFERLVWETLRESRRTWILLTAVWIGMLLAFWLASQPNDNPIESLASFGILAGTLSAGVSVFGPANRTRTYRFLTEHGVRPGLVWTAKLTVWGVFMTTMLPVAVLGMALSWSGPNRHFMDPLSMGGLILEAFVIAVLAGQVLRRSITAWVVAFLATFLLVLPQVGLYSTNMIPMAGLALAPLLVLAISRAWTGDWMNDLRGVVRWLRLAAMLGGAVVAVAMLYVGYRVGSVPDIGSPFPPRSATPPPAALAPEQDAAPDYTRIIAELTALDRAAISNLVSGDTKEQHPEAFEMEQFVANPRDPQLEPVVAWWKARRALIAPTAQAAAKPEARFPPQVFLRSGIDSRIARLGSMVLLLGIDNFQHRSEGDLPGAWEDLRTVFRMAAQVERNEGFRETVRARFWRRRALEWALAWAGDPRQTPAQLRSALTEFRAFPQPAPPAHGLEAEYRLDERTLRREPEVLVDLLVGNSFKWSLLRKLIAPWWERQRALRVLRLIFAQQLRIAELEPWESDRRSDQLVREEDLEWYVASTPLVRPLSGLSPYALHENSLLSRTFEQVAALRIWQLEHGGRYPETLDALVPRLLSTLPLDPYSGQPFRYRRSDGQRLLPLGLSGQPWGVGERTDRLQDTRSGQWLLYSVGPNGHDDGADHEYARNPAGSDLIFPLPP